MRSWPDWQWQYSCAVRSRVSIRGKIPPRCVPGWQSVAIFSPHASPRGPQTGKVPLHGKIRAPCIRKRAPFGKICAPCIRKALQTAVWEYTARRSCQEGALFAARAPRIMHGAQILPFLGAPFERFDLFRVGWGGARGSRTALALYGAVLVFRALSPFVRGGAAVSWVRSHAASSCSPLTRKMLLLSRPPSRETCPLPPCEVCVHSASSPTRGKRIRLASLGMSRLAVHAPFVLRVRFAAARVVDLVGISHEAGTRISVVASATRPKQRDRVVCRRKHGAVMVFR